MSKNTASFTKTILAFFTFGVLPILNLQSILFPVLASYGGQWARIRKSGGDTAFYPRTNLYPLDVLFYISVLIFLVWIVIRTYKNKNRTNILKLYLIASVFPFIWAAITFISGFNYKKCNLPSPYFSCQNPERRILQSLLLHMLIVGVSLLFLKLTTKNLQ